jgi:hypothetical protein
MPARGQLFDRFTGLGAGLEVARGSDLGTAAYLEAEAFKAIYSVSLSGAYQILPDDWGKLLHSASGTNTFTLPLGTDLEDGWNCFISNLSGADVTLSRSGSDLINGGSSIAIASGTGRRVVRLSSTAFVGF